MYLTNPPHKRSLDLSIKASFGDYSVRLEVLFGVVRFEFAGASRNLSICFFSGCFIGFLFHNRISSLGVSSELSLMKDEQTLLYESVKVLLGGIPPSSCKALGFSDLYAPVVKGVSDNLDFMLFEELPFLDAAIGRDVLVCRSLPHAVVVPERHAH